MKLAKFLVICLIAFSATLSIASAYELRTIDVLSVSESDNSTGRVASIALEVRPGSGSVFIDSFPLTRVDTQISTRFAKEYACELSQEDCTSLDFFYVIRSPSTIIGGPSAGAAMTVLTYAVLEDLDIAQNTVMTGTINSGGFIGPVGGVFAKTQAARESGYERVLVPASDQNNIPLEGVEQIPITSVEEAIWYFTGRDARLSTKPIEVPDSYRTQMESISEGLCTRSEDLITQGANRSEFVSQQLSRAATASAQQDFYSAASFCFGAALVLQEDLLSQKDQEALRGIYRQLEEDLDSYDAEFEDQINTLADLEVYMIVRERLVDSRSRLESEDYNNLSSSGLAYSLERFNSALSWSSFFGTLPSQQLTISEERLLSTCSQKVAEAEERINFLEFRFQLPLDDTREELDRAYQYQREKEYALCIFTASKAKAEVDSILTAAYAGDLINDSVELKIERAQQIIALQQESGEFPLLAYSYVEYAKNLDDAISRNLYAEYALELGRIDIYFPPENRSPRVDNSRLLLIVFGLTFGFMLGMLTREWQLRLSKKQHKKKRSK